MAVKIRLRRTGKLNQACHRIVVADGHSPRDGRFIEIIGMYDPRHETEKIDLERVDYWIPRGAQPSETVQAIIKRARKAAAETTDTTAEATETPAETTANSDSKTQA
jgi:small subunit ribosomal protein S16